MKDLKASNKLYKEKMKKERRVARETAKAAREKEKAEQAAEKHVNKKLTTLRKLYNCPEMVRERPYGCLYRRTSVRNMLLML